MVDGQGTQLQIQPRNDHINNVFRSHDNDRTQYNNILRTQILIEVQKYILSCLKIISGVTEFLIFYWVSGWT